MTENETISANDKRWLYHDGNVYFNNGEDITHWAMMARLSDGTRKGLEEAEDKITTAGAGGIYEWADNVPYIIVTWYDNRYETPEINTLRQLVADAISQPKQAAGELKIQQFDQVGDPTEDHLRWENQRRPFIFYDSLNTVFVGPQGEHHAPLYAHIWELYPDVGEYATSGYIIENPQLSNNPYYREQGVHSWGGVPTYVSEALSEHYGVPDVRESKVARTIRMYMEDSPGEADLGGWPVIYLPERDIAYVGDRFGGYHDWLYEAIGDDDIYNEVAYEARVTPQYTAARYYQGPWDAIPPKAQREICEVIRDIQGGPEPPPIKEAGLNDRDVLSQKFVELDDGEIVWGKPDHWFSGDEHHGYLLDNFSRQDNNTGGMILEDGANPWGTEPVKANTLLTWTSPSQELFANVKAKFPQWNGQTVTRWPKDAASNVEPNHVYVVETNNEHGGGVPVVYRPDINTAYVGAGESNHFNVYNAVQSEDIPFDEDIDYRHYRLDKDKLLNLYNPEPSSEQWEAGIMCSKLLKENGIDQKYPSDPDSQAFYDRYPYCTNWRSINLRESKLASAQIKWMDAGDDNHGYGLAAIWSEADQTMWISPTEDYHYELIERIPDIEYDEDPEYRRFRFTDQGEGADPYFQRLMEKILPSELIERLKVEVPANTHVRTTSSSALKIQIVPTTDDSHGNGWPVLYHSGNRIAYCGTSEAYHTEIIEQIFDDFGGNYDFIDQLDDEGWTYPRIEPQTGAYEAPWNLGDTPDGDEVAQVITDYYKKHTSAVLPKPLPLFRQNGGFHHNATIVLRSDIYGDSDLATSSMRWVYDPITGKLAVGRGWYHRDLARQNGMLEAFDNFTIWGGFVEDGIIDEFYEGINEVPEVIEQAIINLQKRGGGFIQIPMTSTSAVFPTVTFVPVEDDRHGDGWPVIFDKDENKIYVGTKSSSHYNLYQALEKQLIPDVFERTGFSQARIHPQRGEWSQWSTWVIKHWPEGVADQVSTEVVNWWWDNPRNASTNNVTVVPTVGAYHGSSWPVLYDRDNNHAYVGTSSTGHLEIYETLGIDPQVTRCYYPRIEPATLQWYLLDLYPLPPEIRDEVSRVVGEEYNKTHRNASRPFHALVRYTNTTNRWLYNPTTHELVVWDYYGDGVPHHYDMAELLDWSHSWENIYGGAVTDQRVDCWYPEWGKELPTEFKAAILSLANEGGGTTTLPPLFEIEGGDTAQKSAAIYKRVDILPKGVAPYAYGNGTVYFAPPAYYHSDLIDRLEDAGIDWSDFIFGYRNTRGEIHPYSGTQPYDEKSVAEVQDAIDNGRIVVLPAQKTSTVEQGRRRWVYDYDTSKLYLEDYPMYGNHYELMVDKGVLDDEDTEHMDDTERMIYWEQLFDHILTGFLYSDGTVDDGSGETMDEEFANYIRSQADSKSAAVEHGDIFITTDQGTFSAPGDMHHITLLEWMETNGYDINRKYLQGWLSDGQINHYTYNRPTPELLAKAQQDINTGNVVNIRQSAASPDSYRWAWVDGVIEFAPYTGDDDPPYHADLLEKAGLGENSGDSMTGFYQDGQVLDLWGELYPEPVQSLIKNYIDQHKTSADIGSWRWLYVPTTNTLVVGRTATHYQLARQYGIEDAFEHDRIWGGFVLGLNEEAPEKIVSEEYEGIDVPENISAAILALQSSEEGGGVMKIVPKFAAVSPELVPVPASHDDLNRGTYGYPVIYDSRSNVAYIGPLGSHHYNVSDYLDDQRLLGLYSGDEWNIWPPYTWTDDWKLKAQNEDWKAAPYNKGNLQPPGLAQALEDWARTNTKTAWYRRNETLTDDPEQIQKFYYQRGTPISIWSDSEFSKRPQQVDNTIDPYWAHSDEFDERGLYGDEEDVAFGTVEGGIKLNFYERRPDLTDEELDQAFGRKMDHGYRSNPMKIAGFDYKTVEIPGEGPDWGPYGGKYWWSGLFDPTTNTLYVGSKTLHHDNLMQGAGAILGVERSWELPFSYVTWYEPDLPESKQDFSRGVVPNGLNVNDGSPDNQVDDFQKDWLRANNPYYKPQHAASLLGVDGYPSGEPDYAWIWDGANLYYMKEPGDHWQIYDQYDSLANDDRYGDGTTLEGDYDSELSTIVLYDYGAPVPNVEGLYQHLKAAFPGCRDFSALERLKKNAAEDLLPVKVRPVGSDHGGGLPWGYSQNDNTLYIGSDEGYHYQLYAEFDLSGRYEPNGRMLLYNADKTSADDEATIQAIKRTLEHHGSEAYAGNSPTTYEKSYIRNQRWESGGNSFFRVVSKWENIPQRKWKPWKALYIPDVDYFKAWPTDPPYEMDGLPSHAEGYEEAMEEFGDDHLRENEMIYIRAVGPEYFVHNFNNDPDELARAAEHAKGYASQFGDPKQIPEYQRGDEAGQNRYYDWIYSWTERFKGRQSKIATNWYDVPLDYSPNYNYVDTNMLSWIYDSDTDTIYMGIHGIHHADMFEWIEENEDPTIFEHDTYQGLCDLATGLIDGYGIPKEIKQIVENWAKDYAGNNKTTAIEIN